MRVRDLVEQALDSTGAARREVLLRAMDHVESDEQAYEMLAAEGRLHSFQPWGDERSEARNAIAWMYGQKLVSKQGPCRHFYEQMLIRDDVPRCLFCTIGYPKTLDHFMPKGEFPELAVTPMNLVPSCRDCNSLKDEFVALADHDQILHPFFDLLPPGRWLEVTIASPFPAPTYSVHPPSDWPQVLRQKLDNHSRLFGLCRLFEWAAAQRVVDVSNTLAGIGNLLPPEALRSYLVEWAQGIEVRNVNDWEAVLLRGLAESREYVEGGFATV